MSSRKFCAPTFSLASSWRLPHCRRLLGTTLLKTNQFLVCRDTAPKQLSSRNAVSFLSAYTTNRFPSPRCASAIQIVRPLESIAEAAKTPGANRYSFARTNEVAQKQ